MVSSRAIEDGLNTLWKLDEDVEGQGDRAVGHVTKVEADTDKGKHQAGGGVSSPWWCWPSDYQLSVG